MQLDKIKISGFKSFVDPTTIHLSSSLTGVVGPNGCGKSNIIDAVRWVMGEISAKHLRGDSMADVIFNGSSNRKPVSHATIELVFDNADGSLGGQYAQYSEISIKRQVSRDGQSHYFLNGTRCRRRDITDIFLGTGLGPRSYSIIEQGMISRLIEAKPEELRVYLEEAAGISKYKERRRETENRIRHTRENLDRLNDLREEVDKQLRHLDRQAKTAEKYKELKQEERQAKAELLALKLRGLDQEAGAQQKIIHERETALEAVRAEQRAIEAAIEKDREAHTEASDIFNGIQSRFYGVGSEIAREEQAIQHAKEMRSKQKHDRDQLQRNWEEIHQHIELDQQQIGTLEEQMTQAAPRLETLKEQDARSHQVLAEAEEKMHEWQREWDDFNQRAAAPSEASQVQKTRIDHLERQIVQQQTRLERIQAELREITLADLENQSQELVAHEQLQASRLTEQSQHLQEALDRIHQLREQNRNFAAELDEIRSQLSHLQGRRASLEALQQSALGKSDSPAIEWLEHKGLGGAPRLAQVLEVAPGWERAVETVLGYQLEAVCIDDLETYARQLGEVEHGSLTLLDKKAPAQAARSIAATLNSHVQSTWPLQAVLGDVYAVDGLDEALGLREKLQGTESVITRDGIWLGASWIRVTRDADEKAGVLQREQEIKSLNQEIESLQHRVGDIQHQLDTGHAEQHQQELQRDQLQNEVNQVHRLHAEAQTNLKAVDSRIEQTRMRHQALLKEQDELQEHLQQADGQLKESRSILASALENIETFAREREQRMGAREDYRQQLEQARSKARNDRDELHRLSLQNQSMNDQLQSTRQNLKRMENQVQGLEKMRADLDQALQDSAQPLADMQAHLEQLLEDRVRVEAELSEARQKLEALDTDMRQQEQNRAAAEQKVQDARAQVEEAKMVWQEFHIRAKTLKEQLEQTGFELEKLLQELGEAATEQEWQEKVESLDRKIQRLGPINLAAIDEFKEQTERKKYLDAQFADVTEALTTLENAIRKIDRETRTRFQETFDRVNQGLKDKFPRVFGGGHAYLELTGEDLLDAGVSVMARPPGKRNSSIHLLSGGEKALTAIALVFSIFDLNPAPFCMLDEVDAPLDDANVGRFCELVKEMSERVQFVFITHNKVTMAMANQLMGVTMNEPGVSRMVSVDVDEAVRLAAV